MCILHGAYATVCVYFADAAHILYLIYMLCVYTVCCAAYANIDKTVALMIIIIDAMVINATNFLNFLLFSTPT